MEDQNLTYKDAALYVSEKDPKDTVSHTDQYLETLMSSESGFCQYFSLIVKIFYNLMIGASTFVLETGQSVIQLFLMAHLSNSAIMLPSTSIAWIFLYPF